MIGWTAGAAVEPVGIRLSDDSRRRKQRVIGKAKRRCEGNSPRGHNSYCEYSPDSFHNKTGKLPSGREEFQGGNSILAVALIDGDAQVFAWCQSRDDGVGGVVLHGFPTGEVFHFPAIGNKC